MKTFTIQALGCKVNQYESRQIGQWLRARGLTTAPDKTGADLVIINTCCVTHAASAKSRQAIRKARKLHPAAAVVLSGCLPAGPKDELKGLFEDIIIVPKKNQLPDTLCSLLTQNGLFDHRSPSKPTNPQKIKHKNSSQTQKTEFLDPFGPLTEYSGQTRAFLKIQDGCDAHCTYCIIPQIRTQLKSKPIDIILREARDLVAAGHPEIVLTGIFLGAWGRKTARRKRWKGQPHPSLPELLERLCQIPNLVRLRLSSLEPADVTDELIEVYKKYPNLVPHLHLPLQSGSRQVLKRMARQYTADQYLQICDKLQAALDRPAITTDIIVGFPGETEDEFQHTLEICRHVNFAKIHVFPFSSRAGTPAARLKPAVPSHLIRRRADLLNQLDQELQQKFRRQFLGEQVQVILEDTDPPRGRCDRYFMVDCSKLQPKTPLQKGQVVQVVVEE